MTIDELITRPEIATEPDRRLDAAVHEVAVGLRQYESISERNGDLVLRYYPGPPGPEYRHLPRYTGSLDATASLVPDGHASIRRNCSSDEEEVYCNALVWRVSDPRDPEMVVHWANTDENAPALALCIAALKAIKALWAAAETAEV